MFTYVMVTVDDKIKSIKRCELYQQLQLQYNIVVSLVAVYTLWTVL